MEERWMQWRFVTCREESAPSLPSAWYRGGRSGSRFTPASGPLPQPSRLCSSPRSRRVGCLHGRAQPSALSGHHTQGLNPCSSQSLCSPPLAAPAGRAAADQERPACRNLALTLVRQVLGHRPLSQAIIISPHSVDAVADGPRVKKITMRPIDRLQRRMG
eukprot:767916-Hanusia_phi.AAC.8